MKPAYLLAVLLLVHILNFVDRNILAIVAGDIKREMSLSDTELGILLGPAFATFFSLAGIPIARLADLTSRRNVIAAGLALWSAMTAASGLSRTFAHIALARFGVSVGEASCTPAAHSLISDVFPPERRATALAIYGIGIYFGMMFGFAGGGWVRDPLRLAHRVLRGRRARHSVCAAARDHGARAAARRGRGGCAAALRGDRGAVRQARVPIPDRRGLLSGDPRLRGAVLGRAVPDPRARDDGDRGRRCVRWHRRRGGRARDHARRSLRRPDRGARRALVCVVGRDRVAAGVSVRAGLPARRQPGRLARRVRAVLLPEQHVRGLALVAHPGTGRAAHARGGRGDPARGAELRGPVRGAARGGPLNDALEPRLGASAIRWSLVAMAAIGASAAVFFRGCARTLCDDLVRG